MYTQRRVLEWGECDPAGIIFYPTYYRWMDAASWAMIAQVGWTAARMRQEGQSVPLVNAQCDFLRSPVFGDECEVRSQVVRWGRSSFLIAHEFVLAADPSRVLARGTESRVWCRFQAGAGSPLKAQEVPAELRAALGEPKA